MAVRRETVRKNVLSKFLFLEFTNGLSIALADVEDHTQRYRSSTARVYWILRVKGWVDWKVRRRQESDTYLEVAG